MADHASSLNRIDTAAARDWLRNSAIAAHRYRYIDPVSRAPVWRRSPGEWNGQHPAETERLYCERTAEVCHRALDEIDRLRASLRDAEETLALVEASPHADPNIRDEVSALGQQVGFGALMVTASALWTESLAQGGYSTGGAFVGGPCRGTVEGTLARIRAALSGEGET